MNCTNNLNIKLEVQFFCVNRKEKILFEVKKSIYEENKNITYSSK